VQNPSVLLEGLKVLLRGCAKSKCTFGRFDGAITGLKGSTWRFHCVFKAFERGPRALLQGSKCVIRGFQGGLAALHGPGLSHKVLCTSLIGASTVLFEVLWKVS